MTQAILEYQAEGGRVTGSILEGSGRNRAFLNILGPTDKYWSLRTVTIKTRGSHWKNQIGTNALCHLMIKTKVWSSLCQAI